MGLETAGRRAAAAARCDERRRARRLRLDSSPGHWLRGRACDARACSRCEALPRARLSALAPEGPRVGAAPAARALADALSAGCPLQVAIGRGGPGDGAVSGPAQALLAETGAGDRTRRAAPARAAAVSPRGRAVEDVGDDGRDAAGRDPAEVAEVAGRLRRELEAAGAWGGRDSRMVSAQARLTAKIVLGPATRRSSPSLSSPRRGGRCRRSAAIRRARLMVRRGAALAVAVDGRLCGGSHGCCGDDAPRVERAVSVSVVLAGAAGAAAAIALTDALGLLAARVAHVRRRWARALGGHGLRAGAHGLRAGGHGLRAGGPFGAVAARRSESIERAWPRRPGAGRAPSRRGC